MLVDVDAVCVIHSEALIITQKRRNGPLLPVKTLVFQANFIGSATPNISYYNMIYETSTFLTTHRTTAT